MHLFYCHRENDSSGKENGWVKRVEFATTAKIFRLFFILNLIQLNSTTKSTEKITTLFSTCHPITIPLGWMILYKIKTMQSQLAWKGR